ncbi:MAG: hypothetical protein JKY95_05575 [Planctomycetaceae bacterium]|nr:hypothetical protein [Planctomycetaceae bacterium]
MDTIKSAQSFLDQQLQIAIWYTEYEGREEAIRYVNKNFSETFGIPVDQILERKKYHLVNPSETSVDVIEQYKNEDLQAIEHGYFLNRRLLEPGLDIVVVKLRFDEGMLGCFRIIASEATNPRLSLKNLDAELLDIVQQLRPDLF